MYYMDHNATTPLDMAVLEEMLPYWRTYYANPSSLHNAGIQQRHVVEEARERIAAVLGVDPVQVIFTSGGTEANNLFMHGISEGRNPQTVWVSPFEHPSVIESAKALTRRGWRYAQLPALVQGTIDVEAWEPDSDTLKGALVSVMLVNNETGAILPVRAIAERAKKYGAQVHTDAVQAIGKYAVHFEDLGVDALTLSGHKLYGPKGIGALIVSKRLDVSPLIRGGGQERGRRSGTESVPLIVGFAEALERAEKTREDWIKHVALLRDRLEIGLKALGARIFAQDALRVANTSYFGFDGIHGDSWVMALDAKGVAVSSGSACSSQHPGPSYVLQAMGYGRDTAESAVRVSLGWQNTMQSIETLLILIEQELTKFRSMPAMNTL